MSAPHKNAVAAQSQGTRNGGMANITSPVAMPSGGITIFFVETAVRVSRTRQNITAIAPAMELTIDRILGIEKAMLAVAK